MFHKVCTVCKRDYPLRELRERSDRFLKTPHGGIVSEMGLVMFNCDCGTTLGMHAEEIYPELFDEFHDHYKHTPRYRVALLILEKGKKNDPHT